MFTGFKVPKSVLSSNSFLRRASNPYLIGDKYYNQLIQEGIVDTVLMNPPKRVIGSINKGIMARADSNLLKALLMKYPIEDPTNATRKLTI